LSFQGAQLAPRSCDVPSSTAGRGRRISTQITIHGRKDSKHDNESETTSATDTINVDIDKRPRNKTLESVIREGLAFLNQTVQQIQANKNTSKPLLQPEDMGPSDKQMAEQHRILSTATLCLDEMSLKDPCLCIHGEPITLIRVEVNTNSRLATVYWGLPYTLMLEDRLSSQDKRILTTKMNEIVLEHGGKLQRRVHGKLSSYYPPKLKFKPAPAEIIDQFAEEFHSW
jgi:hypothetical protein